MATLANGIYGAMRGKAGRIVGVFRGGTAYIRSRPSGRTKSISDRERSNQDRFTIAHYWLKPLLPLVRIGFDTPRDPGRGFARAKSYVMRNALVMMDDKWVVDPAMVKISTGDLPLATQVLVARTSDEEVTITWDSTISRGVNQNDQVMVALYNLEERRVHYEEAGSLRKDGREIIAVESGKQYHVWIAFTNIRLKLRSESLYAGVI